MSTTAPLPSSPKLSRRRVTLMLGAVGGMPLLCAGDGAHREVPLWRWDGSSLGSPVRLLLYHPDRAAASHIVRCCAAEIERLERAFALYRADSEIARLNRDGRLAAPSQEFLEVLSQAQRFAELSDGAFDVTVQPLWNLYAGHFFRPGPPPSEGPPARAIENTLKLVDRRNMEVSARRIVLGRPGMGLTLNGIAQGYVTDRVVDVLRQHGCEHTLTDMGRSAIKAGKPHLDGGPWRIGLTDPLHTEAFARRVDLRETALCTSGGYGTMFEPTGRHHHLFDPRLGTSANHFIAISVFAPSAMIADALSTTLYVAPPERSASLIAPFAGTRALVTRPDGSVIELS
jgi:thiamine biosynthesis lipoprotein